MGGLGEAIRLPMFYTLAASLMFASKNTCVCQSMYACMLVAVQCLRWLVKSNAIDCCGIL